MIEQRLAHFRDDIVLEIARNVDAMDFGAQCTCDRPDLDVSIVAHPLSPAHRFAQPGAVLALKA